MLITIPDVLSVGEVAQARAKLDAAEWVDGKVTAGYQAQRVKENHQLPGRTGGDGAGRIGALAAVHVGRTAAACIPADVQPLHRRRPLRNSRGYSDQSNGNDGTEDSHGCLGYLISICAGRVRRRPTPGGRHLRLALGKATRRTHGAVSGNEPASRGTCDTRSARSLIFLDTEHDPERWRPVAAVRSRHSDSTTCGRGSGKRCRCPVDRGLSQSAAPLG
jgi:hypothetical protein